MKVKCFQNPDGSIRIVRPNFRHKLPEETDDEFIERIAAKTQANDPSLNGLPVIDIDEADLPTDRADRDQWTIKTRDGRNVVEVDPARVR